MKAVRLLLNSYLPDDLKDSIENYDAKSVGQLMSEIARRYPERYSELSKKIGDLGRNAAFYRGATLTLSDMRPTFDKQAVLDEMEQELALARSIRNEKEANKAKIDIYAKYADRLKALTVESAKKTGNRLADSVLSGARGKPAQLQAMITTPALYADYKGDPVPLFVKNSFGQGLRPAEYLASTFGARQSVISTKVATAKGGDLSKQLSQATAPLIVTRIKAPSDNGIDLELSDPSLHGRVLARPAGDVPAGTILDKQAIRALRKARIKKVVVHSPLTDETPEGISAEAVGAGPDGKLPSIGDAVGSTAAQAIGEPVTQGALSQKHTAGQAGAKREYSGFNVINQLLQTPEVFPDRAVLTEEDGVVQSIEDAPQGGKYVTVAGHRHYIQPSYDLKVNVGDSLEKGDQLSEGLIDASDILRLKGLGAARRYYAEGLKRVLENSGMPTDSRNTEMIARAALNHVKISDPEGIGNYIPDDIAEYNAFQHQYIPPATAKPFTTKEAVGKFLHAPALHYTIGTRVTPKVRQHLDELGWGSVVADESPPNIDFEMPRLRTATQSSNDWLAKMHTSFLKKNLADEAARGSDTNVQSNVHFAPRLAIGEGFGQDIQTTGKF